jgi:hypothetical protein
MIRRPLLIALAFAVSALALFGALARITAMTLALERSERTALERATHEENIRIALWRLDATLAELIALENTRPAARFRSASEPAGLLPATRLVRARFEVGADRALRAEPELPRPAWVAALPIPDQPPRKAPPPPPVLDTSPGALNDQANFSSNSAGQQQAFSQEALNNLAFQRRQELGRQSTLARPAEAPPGAEVESAFEARFLDGDLVLLRRVHRGDARLLQGTWLDWPALSASLLAQVEAFVPASRLEPVGADGEADPGRRLALLPVRLSRAPCPRPSRGTGRRCAWGSLRRGGRPSSGS